MASWVPLRGRERVFTLPFGLQEIYLNLNRIAQPMSAEDPEMRS